MLLILDKKKTRVLVLLSTTEQAKEEHPWGKEKYFRTGLGHAQPLERSHSFSNPKLHFLQIKIHK